jgi:hypothetical protein
MKGVKKLLKIYANGNEWNKTQKKSLRKLPLQTDVSLSTCQKIVRKKTRWQPIKVGGRRAPYARSKTLLGCMVRGHSKTNAIFLILSSIMLELISLREI